MWLRRKMLRGSIDEGESCCKDAELLPAPILDVRGGERNSYFGECCLQFFMYFAGRLCVFAEDAEDFALDADVGGGGVDGGHLGVGGLEADHAAFAVEALEGGVGAVDEGDDDLAFAGGAGALDQDVVAGDDVLVAHGVAADLEGEDLAVADDVAEGDALGGLDGLDGLAGGDAAQQGEAIGAFLAAADGQNVDGTAAIVRALKQAFVLQIGDVLVDGGERAEAQAAGDLLVGRGVAVLLGEAGEEVDDLFLPPRDCHADDCSE